MPVSFSFRRILCAGRTRPEREVVYSGRAVDAVNVVLVKGGGPLKLVVKQIGSLNVRRQARQTSDLPDAFGRDLVPLIDGTPRDP